MSNAGQNCHSFNKASLSYAKNSFLQNEIARILLDFCDDYFANHKSIIDLGAGSGNIAKNIKHYIDTFIALDNAPNLLRLHPRKLDKIAHITLLECDFESYDFSHNSDIVLSSSALQWAKNLDSIMAKMAHSNISAFAFAIFTNVSLAELHSFLGTKSPLKSSDRVLAIMQKYFFVESKTQSFHINFGTREDFLAYLKNSALLGGGTLSFSDKKRLRFETPITSANFEVLFIKGKK